MLQVGAISPQNMPAVLQIIRECLENSDWATRKAAADTLAALASHSSHLVAGGASSIIAALESCRFDKVCIFNHSPNINQVKILDIYIEFKSVV